MGDIQIGTCTYSHISENDIKIGDVIGFSYTPPKPPAGTLSFCYYVHIGPLIVIKKCPLSFVMNCKNVITRLTRDNIFFPRITVFLALNSKCELVWFDKINIRTFSPFIIERLTT